MADRPAATQTGTPPTMAGRSLVRPALVALVVTMLGGCSEGVLAPRGPVGAANAVILLDAVAIMAAIVVPTIVAAFVFAWWFRAGNTRAQYLPGFVYSGRLELLVWAIPLLVIMFLGGVIWIGSSRVPPRKDCSRANAGTMTPAALPGNRAPADTTMNASGSATWVAASVMSSRQASR